jgi:succinate dehydrogenase hydrophobic anchor subunit
MSNECDWVTNNRDLLRSFRWMALVCALQHLVVGVIEIATDTTKSIMYQIMVGRLAIVFVFLIAIALTFTGEWGYHR